MSVPSVMAWRCTVCGYVHREAEPPAYCPHCGADRSAFEPFSEEPRRAAPVRAARWRCIVCGYEHSGPEPPDACSVCGSPKDHFEPVLEGSSLRTIDKTSRVVVVGAGIAGLSATEAVRQASPESPVVLISREDDLPYLRLNLTRYLAGEISEEELMIHPRAWYEGQGIDLLLGAEVTGLSLGDRTVTLRDGGEVPFDKLILTSGAHPFVPPFPGAYREGVTGLRTVRDAIRLRETTRRGMACVCIGGGILGLETAGALARQGVDVTLLEASPWLMPRQFNRRAGELLARHAAGLGIVVRTDIRTREIIGDERVRAVALEDGTIVPADLVVVTAGIRPNSYLARRAGLEVNQGVVVNNHLSTSHPDVLAAGDVAEHRGVLYGIWTASKYQGGIAGMNAAGLDTEFGGLPRSNTLKVLGIEAVSVGRVESEDGSFTTIEQEEEGRYYRFLFRDGTLVGAVLLGDGSSAGAVKQAIERKTDLSALLQVRPGGMEVARQLAEDGR